MESCDHFAGVHPEHNFQIVQVEGALLGGSTWGLDWEARPKHFRFCLAGVCGAAAAVGFIIRRPQTSLAAARPTLWATTGAVSRVKSYTQARQRAPHHTHWTSSQNGKMNSIFGLQSKISSTNESGTTSKHTHSFRLKSPATGRTQRSTGTEVITCGGEVVPRIACKNKGCGKEGLPIGDRYRRGNTRANNRATIFRNISVPRCCGDDILFPLSA